MGKKAGLSPLIFKLILIGLSFILLLQVCLLTYRYFSPQHQIIFEDVRDQTLRGIRIDPPLRLRDLCSGIVSGSDDPVLSAARYLCLLGDEDYQAAQRECLEFGDPRLYRLYEIPANKEFWPSTFGAASQIELRYHGMVSDNLRSILMIDPEIGSVSLTYVERRERKAPWRTICHAKGRPELKELTLASVEFLRTAKQ